LFYINLDSIWKNCHITILNIGLAASQKPAKIFAKKGFSDRKSTFMAAEQDKSDSLKISGISIPSQNHVGLSADGRRRLNMTLHRRVCTFIRVM
jgi:hypothetical protein